MIPENLIWSADNLESFLVTVVIETCSIFREKQNFCAVRLTMRRLFPLWSQLNTQVKACEVKLSLGQNFRLG